MPGLAVLDELAHGVVKRGDVVLRQGGFLAGINGSVAVLVLPQPQFGKYRVGGIQPAVMIAVRPGKPRQASPIKADRAVAEHFPAGADLAIEVAVQHQEGIVIVNPGSALTEVGIIDVEIHPGLRLAHRLNAVIVEVQHHRQPGLGVAGLARGQIARLAGALLFGKPGLRVARQSLHGGGVHFP